MVFVYTFAVGGGSGKVVPFPTWALVSLSTWPDTSSSTTLNRIPREIQIIANALPNLGACCMLGIDTNIIFFGSCTSAVF